VRRNARPARSPAPSCVCGRRGRCACPAPGTPTSGSASRRIHPTGSGSPKASHTLSGGRLISMLSLNRGTASPSGPVNYPARSSEAEEHACAPRPRGGGGPPHPGTREREVYNDLWGRRRPSPWPAAARRFDPTTSTISGGSTMTGSPNRSTRTSRSNGRATPPGAIPGLA
jgi:hypothetical protein